MSLKPFIVVLLCACAAAFTHGCASLDPAGDIQLASALVTERSRANTGWTSHWREPAGHWDGRSSLSADTAVRLALQNNRAIRREVESIAASRADLVQAHLLPNPILNLRIGLPVDGMGGDPLGAAAMQQLAWIWRRPATIDAAEAALRAQILTVSDDALSLVAEVRQQHAAVVFAERALQLQQENVELLTRSEHVLQERFAVGEASRLDLNRIEIDRRVAEIRLSDFQSRLALAKRRLLEMLGRAEGGTEWTTDDEVPLLETPYTATEQTLIQLASGQRLDIAAAQARVDGHAAEVDLQERGRLPDVGAGVGFERDFSGRRAMFPSVEVTPKLFDDNSARIAAARAELRQAFIEADRVRQAAIGEARQTWVRLEAEQDVVAAYQSGILELATQNLALAEEAFDTGETDLTVLLEAQQQLNQARIEWIDRERSVAQLLIELERAVGGSLELSPQADASDVALAPPDRPVAEERRESTP